MLYIALSRSLFGLKRLQANHLDEMPKPADFGALLSQAHEIVTSEESLDHLEVDV